MIVLGVDPDTRYTGLALCSNDEVLAVGGASGRGFKGLKSALAMGQSLMPAILSFREFGKIDAVAIETQRVYRGGKADPNNLVLLATVTGVALACACGITDLVDLVYPNIWKGQQPKGVNQKRTLRHYGWKFEDKGPKDPPLTSLPEGIRFLGDPLPRAHLKEVVDAIGIARWKLQNLNG